MFNFIKSKDNEPVISFISMQPGLLDIKDVLPKRSNKFIPQWWIDMPGQSVDHGTIKSCPSFVDYFGQGFIIPAWSDTKVVYNHEADYWNVQEPKYTSDDQKNYDWNIHTHAQFLDYVNIEVFGKKPTIIFKANSPWRIVTKPGWSVMQLPLFYHFDNDLVAMPGIIDTEVQHQINIQLMYFGNGKEITVKRGDPLVQYIPFRKDEKIDFDIRYPNDSDRKKFSIMGTRVSSMFNSGLSYRLAQNEKKSNRLD